MFSYFVRFLVMVTTKQLWLMLSIQLLHAFGFALAWTAMMEYLHVISPKDIMTSMFLIFQSIMFGVAALLANIVGGYLYDMFGGGKVFFGTGVLCGVWSGIITVYYGVDYWKGRSRVKGEGKVDGGVGSTDG